MGGRRRDWFFFRIARTRPRHFVCAARAKPREGSNALPPALPPRRPPPPPPSHRARGGAGPGWQRRCAPPSRPLPLPPTPPAAALTLLLPGSRRGVPAEGGEGGDSYADYGAGDYAAAAIAAEDGEYTEYSYEDGRAGEAAEGKPDGGNHAWLLEDLREDRGREGGGGGEGPDDDDEPTGFRGTVTVAVPGGWGVELFVRGAEVIVVDPKGRATRFAVPWDTEESELLVSATGVTLSGLALVGNPLGPAEAAQAAAALEGERGAAEGGGGDPSPPVPGAVGQTGLPGGH